MGDCAEQYSLKWSDYGSDFCEGFRDLLEEEAMVDVTIAVEGQMLQAHKLVLSVCSPYFKALFKINPCKHPIVILKDASHQIVKCILEFMYKGEVGVSQDDLSSFLNLAESLKVRGLADNNKYINDSQRRNFETCKANEADSDSDFDLETDKRCKQKQFKRRQKNLSRNCKKVKLKNIKESEEEKKHLNVTESADSDSPLIKLRPARNDAEKMGDESSDDGNAEDKDFEDHGNLFNSDIASESADQGLQGKRSEVWNFFAPEGDFSERMAVCLLCPSYNNRLSCKSTGHLFRHLRRRHTDQFQMLMTQRVKRAVEKLESINSIFK